MDIENALRALKERIAPFEKVIALFADSLEAPVLFSSAEWSGFRYAMPDVRHFCLLKGVISVSALNASLELARAGYAQEIQVLMRTIIECTTHIEYVLQADGPEGYKATVANWAATKMTTAWRKMVLPWS